MTRVLILCTGNSCRSQMAEHFLRALDPSLDVSSAGTSPTVQVDPRAVAVMKEKGVDLSGALPKSVEQFLDREFDFVFTVCDNARESCPVFTGRVKHRIHIGFDDPAAASGTDEEVLAMFRRVRDEISSWFESFYLETIRSQR